jgi:hypothetical protein
MIRRTSGLLLVAAVWLGMASAQEGPAPAGPVQMWENFHDVSPPLRDLVRLYPQPEGMPRRTEPRPRVPVPHFAPGQADGALQTQAMHPLLSATVGLNFDGMTAACGYCAVAPPDSDGYVGATQYVQQVNLAVQVFDKTTGASLLGPISTGALWNGFGGACESDGRGDGVVVFDKMASRWVVTQFATPSALPNMQCVAVSVSGDATGAYYRYSLPFGGTFPDSPKIAVWPDAYYESFNNFDSTLTTYYGSYTCAYDRAAMLTGATTSQICFQGDPSIGTLVPSDLDGATLPPAGEPNLQVTFGAAALPKPINSSQSSDSSAQPEGRGGPAGASRAPAGTGDAANERTPEVTAAVLQLYKFHVDFTTPSNSTFTGPANIPVATFTTLCDPAAVCIPQPGTTEQLDAVSDRLMFRNAYRNFSAYEVLALSHSVAAGSSGGVRWYEIRDPNGTPVVAQQGTYAPDSSYRWMPSIAMDQYGDLAVGYSVSDAASVMPSVRIAGRTPSDPPNLLESEANIVAGTGVANDYFRWGDYSAMTVDPVDDCTFWYTQEYMKADGDFNWNTRIANFQFPACLASHPPVLAITKTHSGNFSQGQFGAQYTITISNVGTGPTSAAVNMVDSLPAGMLATGLSGTGWTCSLAGLTCTRADALAGGSSYSAITLTVNVACTAGSPLTNVAVASGGGDPNRHTAQDPTIIDPIVGLCPDFAISATPASQIVAGGTQAIYVVTLKSLNGFTGPVTLSAAGMPQDATITFAQETLTLAPDGTAQTTMAVTTTKADAGPVAKGRLPMAGRYAAFVAPPGIASKLRRQKIAPLSPWFLISWPVITAGLAVLAFVSGKRRPKLGVRRVLLLLILLALIVVFGNCGCPATEHEIYTITITGTSNVTIPALTHSTSVELVVD